MGPFVIDVILRCVCSNELRSGAASRVCSKPFHEIKGGYGSCLAEHTVMSIKATLLVTHDHMEPHGPYRQRAKAFV